MVNICSFIYGDIWELIAYFIPWDNTFSAAGISVIKNTLENQKRRILILNWKTCPWNNISTRGMWNTEIMVEASDAIEEFIKYGIGSADDILHNYDTNMWGRSQAIYATPSNKSII